MRVIPVRAFMACGIALAVSAAACNRADSRAGNEARGHQGAAINLTGCLQKEGGITTTYILTQVNEPTQSVGTSGSSASADVDRERMREAKHSYRLSGDSDQLKDLVGKQVKVAGTIADNSDLNNKRTTDASKPADIDAGDLARVNVNTVTQVSDNCGRDAQSPR